MSKSKSKTDAFAFVRSLFGSRSSAPSELEVEQRKADEEVLDRSASLNLAIAEHFAPLAVATHDPALVGLAIAASREARECAVARKHVTGGGLGGGTQTDTGVTVLIRHSGEPVSDNFHDYKPPSSREDIPVQAGSPKTE